MPYNKHKSSTAKIGSGNTDSTVIYCKDDGPIAAVGFPASFTGATVTFKGCPTEDGTYQTIVSTGTDATIDVETSKAVVLDPTIFYPFPHVKVVSASSEGATRELTIYHMKV